MTTELHKDFQQRVTDLADACGWDWQHSRQPQQDRAGFPDLVLWHPGRGRVLFRMLEPAMTTELHSESWQLWKVPFPDFPWFIGKMHPGGPWYVYNMYATETEAREFLADVN